MQHSTEMATAAPARPLPIAPQPEARLSEFQVFERVTRALQSTLGKPHTDSAVIEAINDNRRLWHALENDLAQDTNLLPEDLKAKLISVAIWVERHSQLAEAGKARLDALVTVNETIMKGLAA